MFPMLSDGDMLVLSMGDTSSISIRNVYTTSWEDASL